MKATSTFVIDRDAGSRCIGICMRLFVMLVPILLLGCTVMRGAPKPIIDNSVFEDPAGPLHISADDILSLVRAQDQSERNAMLDKVFASIDVRYQDFRHSVMANRKHFAAATGVLGTLANIASNLTDSRGVKTNYAQLGLLLSGTKTQVDSTYLFDQTVIAIINQMDADRARLRESVQRLRSKGLEEFSGPMALQACVAYFNAGTVLSAVSEINKSTAENARAAERSLAKSMAK